MRISILSAGVLSAYALTVNTPSAVLRHSDVVFMYQAERAVYQQYGATVLAWGGKPTAGSLHESDGIKVFGSVGMVTEFSRYYERFPQSYEEGLCRDVHGQPVKVPWLTDHQHKGIPFWWCCTQQPQFRKYIRERVTETVKAGAAGVHIDDHMGTSGGLWLGICFCERCVDGFRTYLATLPSSERQRLGIDLADQFNYREELRNWLEEPGTLKRTPAQHPLWPQWTIYQCRASASFMQELRALAAEVAGHPVPVAANAGLLWPRHLADYKALDLFSAETDHQAAAKRFSDRPLFAYRIADAVQRPYAATASGGDWAFIKEHDLPGLVRGWIALSYAAGHAFMVPHRQWCYTPEKGTHWYQGSTEKFAPLYQFVRQNAALFDEYQPFVEIAIVLPHRSFLKDPSRWFEISDQFARKNLQYQLLLGGDEIVDHPLSTSQMKDRSAVLVLESEDLLAADRQWAEQRLADHRAFGSVDAGVAAVNPAVKVESSQPIRVLARVKPGSAVLHLLNLSYDPAKDDVTDLRAVRLQINGAALGLRNIQKGWVHSPLGPKQSLSCANGHIELPVLGLWTILSFPEQ